MAINTFDDIFDHIGGFGRYQMVLFFVNCYMNVMLVFVYFGQIFMTLAPPHWCAPPEGLDHLNLTTDQLRDLTVPRDAATGAYEQCRRYDVDFAEVIETNASWHNTSWPTTTCTHGWFYDYSSLYYPTITSQLNWVCEEDWRPTLAQSLYFAGAFIASPVFGWAADYFGRLPIIVLTNLMGALAGIASAFATSFTSFTVLRVLVGMTYDTHYMVVYILLLEYVSSEYRTIMANVPIMVFLTAGLCVMPWLAVYLANWTLFALAMHVPQLVAVSFIWLVPESARWLLSQGKLERTVTILEKAAKVNKKELNADVVKDFELFGEKQMEEKKESVTILDLFRTPVLRLRFIVLCITWMVIILAYDAHIRNAEHIGPNFFVTFTIVGAVEFPADLLTMVTLEKLGRRHTTVWSLVLSGCVCLVITAVPQEYSLTVLGLEVMGRFLITMSMNVAQQYPVEVLPTVARGLGSGAIHTMGYVSVFLSPYIVYLSKVGFAVPFIIIGIVSIAGGLVSILLPETLDQDLPDTLHDGETFFRGQGYCYNPWRRRSTVEYLPAMREEIENVKIPINEKATPTSAV
ncbi:organic cation transporter protein-like [Eriocheir sinensis]|uniref:organic cation transporter protein-like n=1 Tax=Eriocheir sinensis TaxID=95602 RepID=UPI0021C5AB97|nr:organic cation transporter protein-like [Eriocheir sinensis]XP_050720192.1 organic cation transporter protein-like [Eriocheir sinensis]XP_050720193.1 organic cation transporter protein-like [Eriocheir sinensis]